KWISTSLRTSSPPRLLLTTARLRHVLHHEPPHTTALPSFLCSPHLTHLHIISGTTLLPLCSLMTTAGHGDGAAETVDTLLLSLARGAGDGLAEKRAAVSGQRGCDRRRQGGGSE
ncbi:hypothetical protein Droror1_Dr00026821, partial [Drosera rotundifolia]